MNFLKTEILDAWLIELALHKDERGFFTEAWSLRDFQKFGITTTFKQGNISFNNARGTLRGLHYQVAPWSEQKLVRVTRGSVFDVIVDIRPDSPTFKKWQGFTLKSEAYQALLVPTGCAHGYQTLENSTEVVYEVSELFNPEAARGISWNDPSFKIEWPISKAILSPRDQNHPLFT